MIPFVWVAPERFTLERAVQVALEHSTRVQIARRTALADSRRVVQSSGALKPTVFASANANRYDQATRIPFGNSSPVEVLPSHSETLSVTATQRIDVFGQIRAATDQARLQVIADDLAALGAVRQQRLQATLTYVALLNARGQVSVADAALAAARVQRTQAQTLFDGGIGQRVDLLRAGTALAQAEQNVEAATNQEANARAAFDDLVGLPLDTAIDLEPLTPAGALPDPDAAEKTLARRDDVLMADALTRAAELGVTIALGTAKPVVALQASGSYFPTTSFQFPRQRTAAVGVTLIIPIADGGQTQARVDEARLRRDNARATRDATLSAARLELRQAFLNLKTAARQIETTRTAAEQARAARDLAQLRYAGQVGLYLELSDAQAALVRADVAALDALHGYLAARARFDSAATPAPEETPHV